MTRENVMPLLYVCPEDADGHEDCCYAVRRNSSNTVFVSIVNSKKAVELIDTGRHVMDDGSIAYPNLDDEDWEELFVEGRVEDVDPDELSCHPF
jgi:hypothetical protein